MQSRRKEAQVGEHDCLVWATLEIRAILRELGAHSQLEAVALARSLSLEEPAA